MAKWDKNREQKLAKKVWTYFFFLFFAFLALRHMEVPGYGLNRSYSCWPTPQPQQTQDPS